MAGYLSARNGHLSTIHDLIKERLEPLIYRPGVHSRNYLLAAGFVYTRDGDTARCENCGLEVSNWTVDMVPFTIHSEGSPSCPFVCSLKSSLFSSSTAASHTSISNEQQIISERDVAEPIEADQAPTHFLESPQLRQVRERTFSHWPHYVTPSSARMVEAGFFHCNVTDRAMCIYCNLICEKWTPNVDDPLEVHKTLSPDCIYTTALLTRRGPILTINNNGNLTTPGTAYNIQSLSYSRFVDPAVQGNLGQNNQLAPIDDCIQLGYFGTDKKNAVTCPQCRKSFRNLDSNENPMIDHIRRFPHCPYVQFWKGTAIYRQIHQSNEIPQDPDPSLTWNEETIAELATARLDLPVSQTLLDRSYSSSIVKQCWEEQLRIKGEDFVTDLDLKVACLILQKQSEQFHARRTVVMPSESVRELREREFQAQAEVMAQIQRAHGTTGLQARSSETTDRCVVCLAEKRALAFLPCGHLNTCVPCGYSLRSCPTCRRNKEAVVQICT